MLRGSNLYIKRFVYIPNGTIRDVIISRMPSSGMWRRVGLVETDVSEELVTSIFGVEEITRARKC
jgi:hypothetical protein